MWSKEDLAIEEVELEGPELDWDLLGSGESFQDSRDYYDGIDRREKRLKVI